jgi:hypothetical protein
LTECTAGVDGRRKQKGCVERRGIEAHLLRVDEKNEKAEGGSFIQEREGCGRAKSEGHIAANAPVTERI